MKIISRDNSLLRRVRAVRDGKIEQSIYVEGLRLCEEALKSQLQIEAVIYSDQIARKERVGSLIEKLAKISETAASVNEKLLASVSYTKTPQGIVLLALRPAYDEASFKRKQPRSPLLVLMHRINNPVNVGAIMRTAEAAGVTGVIATAHTTDPFSPKALRGAMGSAFRLPIWTGQEYSRALAWCDERSIRTIAADAKGLTTYTDVDWRRPCALVMGPESNGLSVEEIAATTAAVRIPMKESVESLNVAVAAGILLYEAARQRNQK
jgi:RNA methyltransferase, TrmH family